MNAPANRLQKYGFTAFCLALILVSVASLFAQSRLPEGNGRFVAALIFQCSLLAAALAALCKLACAWLSELGYRGRDLVLPAVVILAVCTAGYVFFDSYYSAEHDIKIYDFSVYWIRLIEDGQLIGQSIPGYLARLLTSFSEEYTRLAVFPLIPASYILGLEFRDYCFAIFSVYYLPACFFLTILALRLSAAARNVKPGPAAFAVCFCLCAFGVALLWPVMRGYLDVSGVLLAAVMLNYTLHWNGVDFDWKRNVALALLSFLLLFTRRWYAYYIVGFYFSFGLASLADMVLNRNFSVKKLGLLLLNMVMIAALACVAIFLINPDIFSLFLLGDYATAYSAYKGMSLGQNLWVVASNCGLLWIAACAAGVYLLVKNSPTRLICLRLLLAAAVAVILFCRVQDMGYHHHYLVLPTIFVLCSVFCVFAVQSLRIKAIPVLGLPLLILFLVNFSFGFERALERPAWACQPVTTAMRAYPVENPYYNAVRQVVGDLGRKIQGTSGLVYVVGDDEGLSPELLKRSFLPEEVDAAPFVMVNNIVDLRDGFPSQLFLADYVLLSDPFKTSFPAAQQVSYQVYEMLRDDPGLEHCYQLDAAYEAVDRKYLLYKKIRPVDRACIDVLKQRLESLYSDTPLVYEPNYFIALSGIDDTVRYTFNIWEKAFELHKEAGRPVEVRLNDTGAFSSVSFSLSCWTPGLELVVSDQNGEILRTPVKVQERAAYTVALSGSERVTFSIAEAESGARIPAFLLLFAGKLQ